MSEDHPDRGRLLAYLDDEIDAERRGSVRRHLEDCPRCRRRLEELESREALFSDVAERLDRPMPEIANPAGRNGSGAAGGTGGAATTRSLGVPPLRAAAVVLLLLVGGALLTPAGRALAERAVNGIAGLFGGDAPTPVATTRQDTAAVEDARPGSQSTAVSASARDGRLRVVIETAGPASGGTLRLGPRADGQALLEGVLRDVERGPGRIRVRVDALDGLLVRLPDSVAAGEVMVGGRRVLLQRGRSVTPEVDADTVDGDILLRVRP